MEVEKHSLSSLGLVFKLCTDSLKNYIFKNKERIPWKTKKAAALTFKWSKQILDALEFIHSKEIVHRDLKLDNVLVSFGGLQFRRVGGQNKRKFAHLFCIKMAVNFQRRKILLFLSTNMAAMTSHVNHQ